MNPNEATADVVGVQLARLQRTNADDDWCGLGRLEHGQVEDFVALRGVDSKVGDDNKHEALLLGEGMHENVLNSSRLRVFHASGPHRHVLTSAKDP